MARTVKKARVDATATGRRRLAVAGLIAFLCVDVFLVGWAARASHAPREDSGVPTRPGSTTAPSATDSGRPAPSATATPVADAVAPARLLAVLDDSTAWRATTGPCPATAAAAELTTDGGATWKRSDASAPTGASSLVRLTVQSGQQASAVALSGHDCTPEFIRTYVAGDSWADYPDQLASAWYAEPGRGGTVHRPGGDVPAPCPAVVGLAVGSGSNAAVLCAGHEVYRTSDNGENWGEAQPVSAAVAIAATDSGYVVASVGAPGCAGTAVATLDPGAGPPTTIACVGTARPAPGTTAIGAGSGSEWLWAGDALARSTDGGKTWR